MRGLTIETRQFGYHLGRADEWHVVWNSGLRAWLAGLSPAVIEEVRAARRADVGRLATEAGIWLYVATVIALGRKSESASRPCS